MAAPQKHVSADAAASPRLPASKRQLPMWSQSGRAAASAIGFVTSLVELDLSCPMSESEADETLREAGIDPVQAATEARALLETAKNE